jgi:hypothetical protein
MSDEEGKATHQICFWGFKLLIQEVSRCLSWRLCMSMKSLESMPLGYELMSAQARASPRPTATGYALGSWMEDGSPVCVLRLRPSIIHYP